MPKPPAGFGPPRHLHRQDDEIFLIEQGAIALWTPHECRTAGPGDVVMLPKVMPHTWRAYGDDPIRFQVTKRNSMAACSHHSEVASRSHKALAWESIPTPASFAPT